ncbi:MAG: hypothetical protein SF029_21790 [bacterium]|nr:hypothetical protein [bacterium]
MKLLLNVLALVGLLLFARVTNPGGQAAVSLFQDSAAKAPPMQPITAEAHIEVVVWSGVPRFHDVPLPGMLSLAVSPHGLSLRWMMAQAHFGVTFRSGQLKILVEMGDYQQMVLLPL